jgi:hypothetical protein
VKESEQDRTAAVESASSETEGTVKRSVAFGAEVADDGSLVPRPDPFDRVEFGGVGRQSDECKPARLLFDEVTGGDASMWVDAVPDHDDRSGQVLVELLEELDDMFGANRAGNQPEEEAGSTAVRGVGRSPDRREMLPVAEAMF